MHNVWGECQKFFALHIKFNVVSNFFSIFFYFNSRIIDLLAWCKEIWCCIWHWFGHLISSLILFIDQCFRICISAHFGWYRGIQNLQKYHASHPKNIRWTSIQVSIFKYYEKFQKELTELFFNRDYLEQDLTLSQDRVQQITSVAVSHANAAICELRRLFLVEDLVDSIKFGVLLYCLTYVGALFNGMTLIILCK